MKGVDYLKSMPEPLYYFNPWVGKGVKREIRPEDNADHYVDTANAYHIVYHGWAWTKGVDLLNGLRIKTRRKAHTLSEWSTLCLMEKRRVLSS